MEEYVNVEDENEKKMCLKKMKGLVFLVVDVVKYLCCFIFWYEGNVVKLNNIKWIWEII